MSDDHPNQPLPTHSSPTRRSSDLEQVAEYDNNKIAPDDFAFVVKDLAERYNQAFIVPESNNHGVAMLAYLDDIYPMHLIYSRPTLTAQEDTKLMNQIGRAHV